MKVRYIALLCALSFATGAWLMYYTQYHPCDDLLIERDLFRDQAIRAERIIRNLDSIRAKDANHIVNCVASNAAKQKRIDDLLSDP